MKAILGFTRMSVRGLNKVKRELGFVLMALNIRKVVAQRAENNQKFIKDNFYIISIEIVFFLSLIKNFMSRTLLSKIIYLTSFLMLYRFKCWNFTCRNFQFLYLFEGYDLYVQHVHEPQVSETN